MSARADQRKRQEFMHARLTPNPLSPRSFPDIHKKRLVYLDQSFLSEMCFRGECTTSNPILGRLFSKLQDLKTMSKIALVVSDIHCRETSDFPGQYADRMEKLWQFQNGLADGRIAANWVDIFVAQHRRMLSAEGFNSYPVTDIGLRDPVQVQGRMNIVMANSWLLRIHLGNTATSDEIDKGYREIINRQAKDIPRCDGVADCQDYVHGLWGADIRAGIAAWRQRRDFELSFEQLGESPDAGLLASLKIPEPHSTPFLRVIDDVIRGLDGEGALQKWSELLEDDPVGPCPSLRIRTAFETELLCDWHEGKRRNPRKFREYFGWSRQNDVDHVSAFVPYVDALTTDKDMHNLCRRKVVNDEIKRFPCKVFSAKNYDEFEKWLDELLAEANLSN